MLGLGFIWFGWSRTILAGIECGFVEPSPAELGWAWLGWMMTPPVSTAAGRGWRPASAPGLSGRGWRSAASASQSRAK